MAPAPARSRSNDRRSWREIELTDRLIDEIVYKLYGLTEDEIAIVEGRPASA